MEKPKESIYFQPETKKKKKKAGEDRSDNRWLKVVIFLIVLLAIIFIIIWFLGGTTTTSGQYPENIRSESLVCENNNIVYEKVNKVDSPNKNLKIRMVFPNENDFSSASLEYTLVFETNREAHDAIVISQAQFNLALQSRGYNSGKFNNKFSEQDNKLVITLNATSNKPMDELTQEYFMVEYDNNEDPPKTIEEYKKSYEEQGFSCSTTKDN